MNDPPRGAVCQPSLKRIVWQSKTNPWYEGRGRKAMIAWMAEEWANHLNETWPDVEHWTEDA